MEICIKDIAYKEAIHSMNLINNSSLKCDEKLLYLYKFLENNSINIYKHINIRSNLIRICGCSISEEKIDKSVISDLKVSIQISCSDSILAESFVIY